MHPVVHACVSLQGCASSIPCLRFLLQGELLLTPGIRPASLFVIAITGRPLSLVFGIKLAGLFEDPTASVGVSGWFIGGAMNLVGPIQYLV